MGRAQRPSWGVPVRPRALTRGEAVLVWYFYGRLPAPAKAGRFPPRSVKAALGLWAGWPPRVEVRAGWLGAAKRHRELWLSLKNMGTACPGK